MSFLTPLLRSVALSVGLLMVQAAGGAYAVDKKPIAPAEASHQTSPQARTSIDKAGEQGLVAKAPFENDGPALDLVTGDGQQ